MVADLLREIAVLDAEKARRDEQERLRKLAVQRKRDAMRAARFERIRVAQVQAGESDKKAPLKRPISVVWSGEVGDSGPADDVALVFDLLRVASAGAPRRTAWYNCQRGMEADGCRMEGDDSSEPPGSGFFTYPAEVQDR